MMYDRDEPEQRLASMVDGIVTRVDEPQQVIVLDNGHMYRVSGDRAILVNSQPVVLGRVQPGTRVSIVSGTPVIYQNGQYVAVAPGSTVVTAPPGAVVAAPPAGTVVTAPPATVAAPVATGSAIRMYGRVSDIETNGNVKVRLPDGNAFQFRPPAGTVARKGDPVTIDMTFGGPAPSALPR
ncbi:MAG TPA: hypothetical protein VGD07_22700 [Methylomirabilota bacterium]